MKDKKDQSSGLITSTNQKQLNSKNNKEKKYESDSSGTEEEYCFKPVKGDATDNETQSLFYELITEDDDYVSFISESIKDGANLYAVHTGKYKGSYPIHIAAYNYIGAIKLMLKSFDDPKKRKEYIFLPDNQGECVLDILIQKENKNGNGLFLYGIRSILPYLTPKEQKSVFDKLSQKTRSIFTNPNEWRKFPDDDEMSEDHICDIWALFGYLKKHSFEMCQQRKQEEAKLQAGYDSDDDSLGSLGEVKNKKFTARVAYKAVKRGDKVESIPILSLIPSDWRLPTATKGNKQGDHVVAYVLLLSSFSHCHGEYIKKLPEIFYKMACRVLPGEKVYFLQKKNAVEKILNEQAKKRKEAVQSLKHECGKSEEFLSHIENTLKRAEVECIARHIEEVADNFITKFNALEGEAFSQERKKSIKVNFVLNKISSFVNQLQLFQDKKFVPLKEIFINMIDSEAKKNENNKSGLVNDGVLNKIAKAILQEIRGKKISNIPNFLKSDAGNITQNKLLAFLKYQTPLKKNHEGHEVKKTSQLVETLASCKDSETRKNYLIQIGQSCAKLFDYPYVCDDRLNNVSVLCKAIPRHLIIFCYAFKRLNSLEASDKQVMYDAFLNDILRLQLWSECKAFPNISKLKENISKFAELKEGDYTMISLKEKKPPLLTQKTGSPTFLSSNVKKVNPKKLVNSNSNNRDLTTTGKKAKQKNSK